MYVKTSLATLLLLLASTDGGFAQTETSRELTYAERVNTLIGTQGVGLTSGYL